MKNIFKILLVVLVLVMALTSLSATAFAAEAQSADEIAAEKAVEKTYQTKEGDLVFVFEDGSEYNVTDGKWIAEPTEQKAMALKFEFTNLPQSLKYMGVGMLCIFVVIGVIILCVFLMNFISYRIAVMKQIKEEEKEN